MFSFYRIELESYTNVHIELRQNLQMDISRKTCTDTPAHRQETEKKIEE
jgi:hypothetical protein